MIQVPDARRVLIDVPLKPIQGARFQPTGFPDLGAATFNAPVIDSNGDARTTSMLLVESPQSMANRLETVCCDPSGGLLKPFEGIPYVEVRSGDAVLTTSLVEAHRLNSPYIEKSKWPGKPHTFHKQLEAEIGWDKNRPHDAQRLARALFKYDPNSLIHGAFLESIAGVLRVPRMLSGFIEAEGVERVPYGGVKNDRVRASKDEGRSAKDGFGNVPFHREEFTAERITAYFNIDLEQLRSYNLGHDAERLLYAWSLFKIRSFLDRGLRLRTACDLDVVGEDAIVVRPTNVELPSASGLGEILPSLIDACSPHFAEPAITVVHFEG